MCTTSKIGEGSKTFSGVGLCPIFEATNNLRNQKRPVVVRQSVLDLVELSGYCPPSPKSLTGAFSKLSFDFDLLGRTSQSGTYRTQQILDLVRASNHARVPARFCGRSAERFGPTLCVR